MAPETFYNLTTNQLNARQPETTIYMGKSYDGRNMMSVTTNPHDVTTMIITADTDPGNTDHQSHPIWADNNTLNNLDEHWNPNGLVHGLVFDKVNTNLGEASIRVDTYERTDGGTYYAAIAGSVGSAIFDMKKIKEENDIITDSPL
jgi:hypothetical protein